MIYFFINYLLSFPIFNTLNEKLNWKFNFLENVEYEKCPEKKNISLF